MTTRLDIAVLVSSVANVDGRHGTKYTWVQHVRAVTLLMLTQYVGLFFLFFPFQPMAPPVGFLGGA